MPQSEEEEIQERRRWDDRWHVGKEIPIALVGAVVVQTAGLVWSIAGLYNKVDSLVATTNEMKLERYTKEDGRRDRELMTLMNEAQRQRAIEQDRRITILESIVNQLQVNNRR